MRTLSRIACAALVGTALFGVVGLSSTATAPPARPLGTTATVIGDDEVSTSATRAFWIENRTSEGMTAAPTPSRRSPTTRERDWC